MSILFLLSAITQTSLSRHTSSKKRESGRDVKSDAHHLEYFDDYFLIVCNVDGFEHFAVLSSAELSHQLIIILIPANTHKTQFRSIRGLFFVTLNFQHSKRIECGALWDTVTYTVLRVFSYFIRILHSHSPPLYDVRFIVPVFSWSLCVDVWINARSTRDGAGHDVDVWLLPSGL